MIYADDSTIKLAGELSVTVAEAMVVIQHLYEYLLFIDKDGAESWLDDIPDAIRNGAKVAPTYEPNELIELDEDVFKRMLGDEDDDD